MPPPPAPAPAPGAGNAQLSSAVTDEWFNTGTTGERGLRFQARLRLHPSGPTPAGKGGAEDARPVRVSF